MTTFTDGCFRARRERIHVRTEPEHRAGAGGSLHRIDLAGGPARTLAPAASSRATWGRGGVILFEGPDDELYRVPEAGGQPTLVMTPDAARQERFSWPHFLPDGRRYLIGVRSGDAAATGICLASLDSTERTLLVNAASVEYGAGYLFSAWTNAASGSCSSCRRSAWSNRHRRRSR